MAWYQRKEISMVLTAAILVVFLLDWHLNVPQLRAATDELTNWGTVIAAFAIGLGFISLFQHYGKKVQKRSPGWIYAVWLLIATIVVSIFGIYQGVEGSITGYVYTYITGTLDGTFYSIALFYMASAAYRSFKFRSLESTLLLLSAFMVLLKNAPVGAAIWDGFGPIGTFVMNYPTMGVARGVAISIAFASIALALRVILGKEYSFLAGTSEAK